MAFLAFMNTSLGRGIRIVGGLALIGVAAAVGGRAGVALGIFALAPIATGIFGLCPINPLFGQPVRACAVPKANRVAQS